jgi:hypothetical protein
MRTRTIIVCLMLSTIGGCGGRGSLSGKVLLKDKPLPGGTVIFIHPGKGSFTATIQADGGYKIDNLPSGTVKVAVTGPPAVASHGKGWTPSDADLEKIKQTQPGLSKEAVLGKMGVTPSGPRTPAVVIPERYSDPEQSGLTLTIVSGPQNLDIKLD